MTVPKPNPPTPLDDARDRLARWRLEEFAAWLAAHPTPETVGWATYIECCPLANWSGFYIYRQGAAIGDNIPRTLVGPLPAWAERFRVAVDAHHPGTDITAAHALEILEVEQCRAEVEAVLEHWKAARRRPATQALISRVEAALLEPIPADPNAQREALAAFLHELWISWVRCLLIGAGLAPDGSCTLPATGVATLQRLMAMPYSELSEDERQAARMEARDLMRLFTIGERTP